MNKPPFTPGQIRLMRAGLTRWYQIHRRELPWRGAENPYHVLVSEFMLQQTQVATVLPYYDRFLGKFPTLQALADAPEADVRAAWSGLGYYRRARNLQAAAASVVRDHAGQLPNDLTALRALPGVGDYTAAALGSIVHGIPRGVVDGNVVRALTRLTGHAQNVTTAASRRFLQELADLLVDPAHPGDWNQAVMELGSRICTPRNPSCPDCPWKAHCTAFREGTPERYPVKNAAQKSVMQTRAVAVIRKDDAVLLVRRSDPRLLDDTWELPGIVVEPGGDARESLRGVIQQLGTGRIRIGRALAEVKHSITNRRITVQAYTVTVTPPPRARAGERRWVLAEEIGELPMSSMTLKVLDQVRS